jgi:CHAT domain-containing protein
MSMAQAPIDSLREDYLQLNENGKFNEAGETLQELVEAWAILQNRDSVLYYRYRQIHMLAQSHLYEQCVDEGLELVKELENLQEPPSFLGAVYFTVGSTSPYIGEMNQAISLLDKAISWEKNSSNTDTINWAKATEWKGLTNLFMGDLETARGLVEEALEIRYMALDSSDKEIAYNLNSLASVYSDLGYKRKAKAAYIEAYRIMKIHMPPNHPHLSAIRSNLSITHSDLGELEPALNLMKEAIRMHEETESYFELCNEYFNLGSIYMSIEDYENALLFMKKSEVLADSLLSEEDANKGNIYDGIGSIYFQTNELAKADSLFRLSLNHRKSLKDKNEVDIAQSIYNLGLIARERRDYDLAYKYFQESASLRERSLGPEHPKTANSYVELAFIDWINGEHRKALSTFKSCIPLYENSVSLQNQWTLEVILETAKAHLYLNELDSARNYLELSWESIFRLDPGSFDYEEFPNYEIGYCESYIFNIILFHFDLLDYESRRGQLRNEELADLLRVTENAMTIILPLVDIEHRSNELLNRVNDIYKKAAALAAQSDAIDELEGSLLHNFEQRKSLSIRSAIQNRKAMSFANLPDSVLKRDREIREKLRFVQAQIDESEDTYWEDLLFETLNEWNKYQTQIREEYPEYHALRFSSDGVQVEKLNTALQKKQASLVIYLKVDSGFIAFLKNEGSFDAFLLDGTEFTEDSVRTYRKLIERQASPKRIGELAFYLYQVLWKPLDNGLEQTVMIFPDGALNFLNFETLVSTAPSSQSYSEWDWLIHKHEIIVQNKLPANPELKKSSGGVLAIAPGFEEDLKRAYQSNIAEQAPDSTFLSWVKTPWSLELAEDLGRKSGQALTRTEANEQRLREEAPNAAVLHFGTHAVLSDREPLLSFLALTPQPNLNSDGYLYAHEIYNLPLQAGLAVLTACETGLGTQREGDGVVSLSYALQYAGCPNVVYSLWEIDDQQSTEIMRAFYENLNADLTISSSLRQAKIDYLKSARGDLASPYYWGGIVLTGENGQVDIDSPTGIPQIIIWVIFAITFTFGMFLFLRKASHGQKRSE